MNDATTKSTSPLRLERLRRGMTILELAQAAGCCPSTISNAEKGYFPNHLVARLAVALGVPVATLKPPADRRHLSTRASTTVEKVLG
jgi:transcriptional regulator with XRE-family HTH domain